MPYDPAIDAIENAPRLSYQWFREKFRDANGSKDSLNSGHAVIATIDQLNQYLHTYGPMIESQWKHVTSRLSTNNMPNRLIDYGCGQGLAGLLLRDHLANDPFRRVEEIILIEPSAVALERAEAIYRRLAPHASVTGICKLFDDVGDPDMPADAVDSTLHLFSNSLDVTGYKALPLIARSLHPGHHTIVAVSHDRDFNGGTPLIIKAKDAIEELALVQGFAVKRSEMEYFKCDNPSKSDGVVWICESEVADG